MKKFFISVHPLGRKMEFRGGGQSLKDDVSPCLRATDYKNPHCVWEIVYEDENRQTDSSRTDAE